MATHEQYILHVTAGATYDTSKHQDVLVNSEKPVDVSSDLIDAKIHMRIKDYRGLPEGSPKTSPYFSTPQHPYDRYSISFSFTPKHDIAGDKLVFGNDFDHPIRDRLPPLFDKAFGIVKWWIDPGLDGDVYADEPYLYGALLSSINVLRIGSKADGDKPSGDDLEGEAQTQGDVEVPDKSGARQKFFLTEQNRKDFVFEAGREYKCDFFNPYLDFNEFALKIGYGLPNISMIGHWDGQPLRYVTTFFVLCPLVLLSIPPLLTHTPFFGPWDMEQELFVVVIELLPTEQARKEGAEDPKEKFEQVHGSEKKEEKNEDLD